MKKKCCWLLLGVLIIFFTVLPAIGAEVLQHGTITGSGVNLRSGPGKTASVIQKLERGTDVLWLETRDEWVRVRVQDGLEGWIWKEYFQFRTIGIVSRNRFEVQTSITAQALRYVGSKYVYGGKGPTTFDCSGFTRYIFGQEGVGLPHSAAAQILEGESALREELAPGDLVFFCTGADSDRVNHVGIYLGGDNFIHASSSYGEVRVSSLNSEYYVKRYAGARRLIHQHPAGEEPVKSEISPVESVENPETKEQY